MTSTTIDLWPNDIKKVSKTISPVAILRQQAILIGKKTSNIIEGEIKTLQPTTEIEQLREWVGSPEEGWSQGIVTRQKEVNPNIVHVFFLVAPILSNYRHRLLEVQHIPIQMYPVTIKTTEKTIECIDEKTFIDGLQSIFADATTRQIIESLISQSTS
jgi:hypothetical protein